VGILLSISFAALLIPMFTKTESLHFQTRISVAAPKEEVYNFFTDWQKLVSANRLGGDSSRTKYELVLWFDTSTKFK